MWKFGKLALQQLLQPLLKRLATALEGAVLDLLSRRADEREKSNNSYGTPERPIDILSPDQGPPIMNGA